MTEEPLSITTKDQLVIHRPEVGIGASQWFSIPSAYRKVYAREGIIFEQTKGCTVACSFCRVAERGKIQAQTDWETATRIIDDLPPQVPYGQFDYYYWGSEPYDMGGDHKYLDLLKYAHSHGRRVSTSTGLPYHKEEEIVNTIKYLGDRSSEQWDFRISVTSQNQPRFNNLISIFLREGITFDGEEIIYQGKPIGKVDYKLDEKSIRAPSMEKAINIGDLIGPTCRDSVIIHPLGVDALITMPQCSTVPSGSLRIPIVFEKGELILPEPKYTYHDENLSLSFFSGEEGIKNIEFIKSARKLLEILNRMTNRKALLLRIPKDPSLYATRPAVHVWATTSNNLSTEPISSDEAKRIFVELELIIGNFQGDPILLKYSNQMVTDMQAISEGKYHLPP